MSPRPFAKWGAALAAIAVAASTAGSCASAGPVSLTAIRIEPIGEMTGTPFTLSDSSSYDDLPSGRPGREPADSFLVDVEVRGPPGGALKGTGLTVQVFAVPSEPGPGGKRRDSVLVAERTVDDLDFGPSGTRHEAVFVVGHLCEQVAVLATIGGSSGPSMKAEAPFSCGGR